MQKVEEAHYGNPSSIHQPGQAAKVTLEQARKELARALSAQPKEIVFTSGGTEANNLVLFGVLNPGDHVVSSMIEHPSVENPLARLEELGVEVTWVSPSPKGHIPVSRVADAIQSNTRLISVMAVNNETGVINDLAGFGALAAKHDLLFHTDAVQAFGKLPIDAEECGIHFLSASAHKIGGPTGIGLLYSRQGIPFRSHHLGGSQENNHRAGTENVAGAVGFAHAAQLALEEQAGLSGRLATYRRMFLDRLKAANIRFHVNGDNSLPAIINLRFPDNSGHALVINLDMHNIAISYGSSCASGSAKPSHVLLAMDLSEAEASHSVRFSFGYDTTEEDIVKVAGTVARITSQASEPAEITATVAT
jgi:cysteine desulfurase